MSANRILLFAALVLLPLCASCRVNDRYASSTDVARLNQLRDRRKLEARAHQEEIRRLDRRIQGLKLKAVSSREERDRLAGNLAPLLDTLANLRQDVGAASAKVDREKKILAGVERERQALAKRVAAARAAKTKLAGELKAIQVDLPGLRARLAKVAKEGTPALQAARKQEAALLARNAKLTREVNARIAEIQRMVKELEAKKATLYGPPKKPVPKPKKK